MQVLKFGVLLVLATLGSSFTSNAFAESEIIVEFNQAEYQTGDSLIVSGHIQQVTMPEIAMSIYDPDGKILTANSIEIDSENNFSKTILLESPFYEKPGEYKIKLDYLQITQNEYFIISGESFPELIFEDQLAPEIILLLTDKLVYTDGDTITITGLVSSMDSPTALVGVYDTFGTPAGFYFGEVDSNLEFTVSFLAKAGVNFKTDGTYSIKAHYAESEQTIQFDFYNEIPSSDVFEEIDESFTDANDNSSNKSVNEVVDETPETTIDETPETTIDETPETTIDETPETKPISEIIEEKNIVPKTNPEPVNDSPLIKTPKSDKPKSDNNSINTKNSDKNKTDDKQFQKTQNLSVDDIELGLMLNQINLNCDSSTYTDSISYYDGMGPALYRLCKFDSSIDYFDKSLIDDPDNTEILTNKGSALRKLGLYSEALNFYDRALKNDPSYLPALNNKANLLAILGQYEEAVYLYQLVLQENPNYLTVRKNLTIALSEMSSTDTSAEIIQIDDNSREPEPAQTISVKNKIDPVPSKQNSNFFEELGNALSSLFGFLN